MLTQGILDYWHRCGLTPVAAQLPVVVVNHKVVTCADIIVQDVHGKLWMHEIKTGGIAINLPKKDGWTKRMVWDLQRFCTAEALVQQGLPLVGSKIVNAYIKEGVVVVEAHNGTGEYGWKENEKLKKLFFYLLLFFCKNFFQ